MKFSDIRAEFHNLIDEFDNEELLLKFYDLMSRSELRNEGELWKMLSEDQKQEVLLAESESHYPENLIDSNTQKSKHQKWL